MAPGTPVPPSPQLQRLFLWALQQGAQWSKISYPVHFSPGYLGSSALQDISSNETILTVPDRLLLTAKSVESSEIGGIIRGHPELFSAQHPWHEDLRLIAYLLYVKSHGRGCFWEPFVSMLPTNPESLLVWTESELAELQDEHLVSELKERHSEMQRYWHQFRPVLTSNPQAFSEEQLTYEEFLWAQLVISSRSFGKRVPSATLCPIAELLNHSPVRTYYTYGHPTKLQPFTEPKYDKDDLPRDLQLFWPVSYELLVLASKATQPMSDSMYQQLCTTARDMDSDRYASQRVTAVNHAPDERSPEHVLRIVTGPEETYAQGAEVYLNYGAYSNRQLLLYYGFALNNNPYNYEYIVVPLGSILTGTKLNYLRDFHNGEQWSFKIRDNEICMSLLRTLRAVMWRDQAPEACFRPVNLILEREVVSKAVQLVQHALGEFPTTAEQDAEKLTESMSMRKKFALMYRSQRKSILSHQIHLLSTLSSLLGALQDGQSVSSLRHSCPSSLHIYFNDA